MEEDEEEEEMIAIVTSKVLSCKNVKFCQSYKVHMFLQTQTWKVACVRVCVHVCASVRVSKCVYGELVVTWPHGDHLYQ